VNRNASKQLGAEKKQRGKKGVSNLVISMTIFSPTLGFRASCVPFGIAFRGRDKWRKSEDFER
jgi:hypothetical protein